MSKPEYYTQCKLVNGTTEYVAFIPSKFAFQGKELTITENGKKNDWTVLEVYGKVDYNDIKNQQHNSGGIWAATSGSNPRGNK